MHAASVGVLIRINIAHLFMGLRNIQAIPLIPHHGYAHVNV